MSNITFSVFSKETLELLNNLGSDLLQGGIAPFEGQPANNSAMDACTIACAKPQKTNTVE